MASGSGIPLGFGFDRSSPAPIDNSLTLTKAEMLAVDDSKMPEKYFTICLDDGKLYLYDKSATPSAETGKFKKLAEGGGGGATSYTDLEDLPRINSVELLNNKTGGDLGLQDKMAEITNSEIDTIVFG